MKHNTFILHKISRKYNSASLCKKKKKRRQAEVAEPLHNNLIIQLFNRWRLAFFFSFVTVMLIRVNSNWFEDDFFCHACCFYLFIYFRKKKAIKCGYKQQKQLLFFFDGLKKGISLISYHILIRTCARTYEPKSNGVKHCILHWI